MSFHPIVRKRLGALYPEISSGRNLPMDRFTANPPSLLRAIDTRIICIESELQLDTDGWPDGVSDPDWQATTSMTYVDGTALDANAVPYFVLPLEWYHEQGAQIGDFAAILFENFLAYAVFGDEGPVDLIGEGSLQLLRLLGQERLDNAGNVINSGMGPGVVTVVFCGSSLARSYGNQLELLRAIEREGKRLLRAAGGEPDAK